MGDTSWVEVVRPKAQAVLPLLCDSPHSGTHYPADFGHVLPMNRLRGGEDTHVETLWSHASEVGATLIAARFPRTYIDPNRSLDDLDVSMLADEWPGPVAPSKKTSLGIGLIWRQVGGDAPIYARQLSAAEVQRRIECCWLPYRQALLQARETALRAFGRCWHLNLHSMPSNAYERLGIRSETPLADVVLGDLHGRSCSDDFRNVVQAALSARGFRVAVNDPYPGQEIVRLMGAPDRQLHSLQVELNRALYMDEATRRPNARFDEVRSALGAALEDVARYVRAQARGADYGFS
ncbi:MAG: N-formylglutamate amidohydrolase [Geminicoccaceae bacterium]